MTEINLRGGRPAAGGSEARGERAPPAGHHQRCGEGAGALEMNKRKEDISKLRRKIEKAKKPAENIRNGDEILNEEINDYKARLTCPCCNSRVKDAVLTKCFHVFCFECVKTRYDTRQRKCPKCNAAFGANDFHRIYIG
ncbi:hypothetical protein cypCar_00030605 [Cyprinus carpio]|nr:hypothetical protein cypCar_00030605 [Cyprinus carpio]